MGSDVVYCGFSQLVEVGAAVVDGGAVDGAGLGDIAGGDEDGAGSTGATGEGDSTGGDCVADTLLLGVGDAVGFALVWWMRR